MERQQIGSLEKGERRRAERKSAAGQETGDEASWWGADREGNGQRGKDRESDRRQDGGQGPSELVLVSTWIRQLPKLQVDPIFGSQHHDWSGHRDPGGIR